MWRRNENDWILPWYPPCTSRVYFTEEQIDQDRECPQVEIVEPRYHSTGLAPSLFPFLLRHGCDGVENALAISLCARDYLKAPVETSDTAYVALCKCEAVDSVGYVVSLVKETGRVYWSCTEKIPGSFGRNGEQMN